MRRRYRRQARRAGALSPLAIAGIAAAAVILLTVLVGNLLTLWLDDETYARLTEGTPEEEPAEVLHKTNVPNVNAYPFVLGDDPSKVLELPAVSISINQPDGALAYTSEVSDYLGLMGNQNVSLTESMDALSRYTVYVSGVFYPQAFRYDTENLRFSATAAEGALLREFVRGGARDVILASIPFESVSITDILSYVKSVKTALGETPLGVAIPLSIAQRESGWELLSTLLEVCDFCVLDVTSIKTGDDGSLPTVVDLLGGADYFLTQYDMRLMITDAQADLRSEIELRMIADYQIVKAPPAEVLP